MTKRQINSPISYKFPFEYQIEIKELKKHIEAVEKLGATHLQFENCSFDSLKPIIKREETNEEFKKRMIFIQRSMKILKNIELKELKRLKLKYNK